MSKERSNLIEHEFKFLPFGESDEASISVFRKSLCGGDQLILYDTFIALHLYLNTPKNLLLEKDASLRIQLKRKRRSVVVTFKLPRVPNDNQMIRREVRTSYKIEELLAQVSKPRNPSGAVLAAWASFYDSCNMSMNLPSLIPIAWVQSFRRVYVAFKHIEDFTSPQPLIAILLEDVRANLLESSNLNDVVSNWQFDVTKSMHQIGYSIGEVEAISQHTEFANAAIALLGDLEQVVVNHTKGQFERESKYAKVLRLLSGQS